LYPDSNIIGGSSTMKKIVGLKASVFYKKENKSSPSISWLKDT
jgi:hypothetical protein